MTQALADACRSSLGSRRKPFPHPGLINFRLFNIELIHIHALGAFSVSHSGSQRLETTNAERFGVNFKIFSASSTPLPRI